MERLLRVKIEKKTEDSFTFGKTTAHCLILISNSVNFYTTQYIYEGRYT